MGPPVDPSHREFTRCCPFGFSMVVPLLGLPTIQVNGPTGCIKQTCFTFSGLWVGPFLTRLISAVAKGGTKRQVPILRHGTNTRCCSNSILFALFSLLLLKRPARHVTFRGAYKGTYSKITCACSERHPSKQARNYDLRDASAEVTKFLSVNLLKGYVTKLTS